GRAGGPRAVETDSEGRFEAANLKPGTYRVEITTPNFKKYERTGLLLRAAGTARVDAKLELGGRTESVVVSAEALNNITLDSGAITRGLDEQQLHDLNPNALKAPTYNQKLRQHPESLAGLRSDPNSDTHEHRWGASIGGPIKSGKTFFYANYEGSNDKAIFGGSTVSVPTAAMRNGDFSRTTSTIRDPLTGQPFPGNVIPADRISPQARKIMDFFYPLPNRNPLSSGI